MNPYFGLGLEEYSGNPVDDQQRLATAKHMPEGLAKLGNTALSIPLSMIAPDPRLTELTGGPNLLNYVVPFAGVPQTAASMASGLIDAAGTIRNAVTGNNTDWDVSGITGLRKLGEHVEKTREEIKAGIEYGTGGVLPAPDMNTPEGQFTDSLGSMIGMGAPAVPRVIADVVRRLAPYGTKTLTHMFTPSTDNVAEQLAGTTRLAEPITILNEGGASLDEYINLRNEAKAAGIPMPQSNVVDPATQLQLDAQSRNEPTPAPPPTQVAEAAPRVASDTRPPIVAIGPGANKATAQPEQVTEIGPGVGRQAGANGEIAIGPGVGGPDQVVPMQQGQGIEKSTIGGALAATVGALTLLRAGRGARERNAGMTEAARAARMNDPVYAAAAQDYNNKQLALHGGNGPMSNGMKGPAPEAPLPWTNQLRTSLNADNTNVLDKTARAQEIIRTLGESSSAEALAKEYGLVHNDGASRVAYDAFLDTGYHPETGVQIPSPNRVAKNTARLSEAQRSVVAEGMFSANEQNNRTNNRAEFARNNPGKMPTDADIRHDLKYHTDEQLQAAHDAMLADPATAAVARDMWAQSKGMREIARKLGVLPASEEASLNSAHPHYLPETGLTGKTMTPLSQRDRTLFTGVDQVNSKPWMAQAQALEDLHRELELRKFRRDLYDSLSEAQRRYPDAAKIFTEVAAPTDKPVYYSGGDTRGPVVAIHTGTGTKYVHIANSDVLNMFTGDSLKQAHIKAEMSTIPRRIYQNFTTGVGSLATGSFAAGRNLLYTIPAMSINTPKGMNAGLLHKGVRAATGGRWDSGVARGLDMFTNLGYVPYSYARGVGERRLRNIANVLDPNATNSVNKWLRASFGDAPVNNMQTAAQRFYRESATYDALSSGMGGGGLGPKSELQPLNLQSDMKASIAAAHAVPELYHSGSWMGTKPFVLNLHSALLEALSNISEAGHMASFRLNRDNPNISRPKLISETRALTGDPSVSGANPILKNLTDRLPFTNITLQGTARAVRGVAEKPLNAAMTMATGFGSLQLISLLTAMQSPETLKNFEDELSTQEHASRVPIYFPNGYQMQIPIAGEYQPANTFVKALVANLANVVAMQHDPLTFTTVQNMILDFLGAHISTAHMNEMKYSVANTANVFLGHPLIGGIDAYKLWQGEGLGNSFHTPLNSGPGGSVRTMPNQVADGALEGKEGQLFTKGLAAIFGLAGSAFAEHAGNFEHYVKQYGNWSDAIGQVGRDWMQRAGDRNPAFAAVMEHPMRLSLMPPIIEQTERDIKWMKGISGSRTEPIAEGTTGRNRYERPTYNTGPEKIPTDPHMLYMWQTIEATNKRIAPQQQDIASLRKQMASVATHGMGVEERRKWMNNTTRELADKYRYIHDTIQDTNLAMSRTLNRNVHVGMNIDWQKGPEQFTE